MFGKSIGLFEPFLLKRQSDYPRPHGHPQKVRFGQRPYLSYLKYFEFNSEDSNNVGILLSRKTIEFAPWSSFRGRAATATVAVKPNPRAAGLLAGWAHKGCVVQGIRCCAASSSRVALFSFCSILIGADFVVNLHIFRSAAKASRSVVQYRQPWGRVADIFIPRLGLPVGLEPVASSPYNISFGILPSSMRATCPSQRSLLFASMLNMLGISARLRASSLVKCCCQEIPRISLMHRRWKAFSLCSCLE